MYVGVTLLKSLILGLFGLESGKALDGDMLSMSVVLALSVVLFLLAAAQSKKLILLNHSPNSDSSGHVTDSLVPDGLVELWVYANIIGQHIFLGCI